MKQLVIENVTHVISHIRFIVGVMPGSPGIGQAEPFLNMRVRYSNNELVWTHGHSIEQRDCIT